MLFKRFNQRSDEIELMDSDSSSFLEFNNCLRHLEWINIFTLAYLPTYFWFKKVIASNRKKEKILIFDVGSGGGDMLRKIWKWSSGAKTKFILVGIDINPWSKKSAEELTPKTSPIKFETANVFTFDYGQKPDFIISSLFTHHLNNDDLVKFINWMDGQALQGWFINDLHRHFIPYFFIKWLTALLPFNRLVKNDAAVSVARAFTAQDLWMIIDTVGIDRKRIKIKWFFPFRYSITCEKL